MLIRRVVCRVGWEPSHACILSYVGEVEGKGVEAGGLLGFAGL